MQQIRGLGEGNQQRRKHSGKRVSEQGEGEHINAGAGFHVGKTTESHDHIVHGGRGSTTTEREKKRESRAGQADTGVDRKAGSKVSRKTQKAQENEEGARLNRERIGDNEQAKQRMNKEAKTKVQGYGRGQVYRERKEEKSRRKRVVSRDKIETKRDRRETTTTEEREKRGR